MRINNNITHPVFSRMQGPVYIPKPLRACAHGGEGPQVGEVTLRLSVE